MPNWISSGLLRDALLSFAWDEWAQMGVLASPRRHSPWAQDPEALLVFTLDVARSDPRLFDEVLSWLLVNESLISARRLRSMSTLPGDAQRVDAALAWAAHHGRRPAPRTRAPVAITELEPLFFGLDMEVRDPDPAFAEHGLLRGRQEPTGKASAPDIQLPLNFAFRLRHLLGVGARSEVLRFLLTVDAPRVTAQVVTRSAGFAKRNVQETLGALHAAGVVSVVTVGTEQRFAVDHERWRHLLDADAFPVHRDWPQLLTALRRIHRALREAEERELSDYLRASQTRDLLEEVRDDLQYAGVRVPSTQTAATAGDDLAQTVESALQLLQAAGAPAPSIASQPGAGLRLEVYADTLGSYRWRLRRSDGRTVATSAETFGLRTTALLAAARFKTNAGLWTYVDYPDADGRYRWRARSLEAQTVAVSTETFGFREAAQRAAAEVRAGAGRALGP